MKLRKLQKKDAPFMLEWMHDKDVVEYLNRGFETKDIQDCERFIEDSQETKNNLHLAIADENDIYMGTVSLKHINPVCKTAEFAITVRKCAMGKDFSKFGMEEILRIGLKKLGIEAIYWCVSKENKRAIRFYDKNQYQRTENVPNSLKQNYETEQLASFVWYVRV